MTFVKNGVSIFFIFLGFQRGHVFLCAFRLAEQILAYGVPILVHVMKKKRSYVRKRPSPIGLVLASSDELSQKVRHMV